MYTWAVHVVHMAYLKPDLLAGNRFYATTRTYGFEAVSHGVCENQRNNANLRL